MVKNSTNINKNHLSPQLIEWWLTIPPISTKITSHLNSLSDGQQFHNQYQQTPPLTSTHWVMVNNSTTNINKNHPSIKLIDWWSTIPLNELKSEVVFVDIGCGIVDHHQYQQKLSLTSTHWVMVNNSTNIKSPLTLTHWVTVNNSTNINKNHLSPQLIEWWSTIPPISANITSHLNSLSDCQQFHSMSWGERWFLLILVELLTVTQWVKVRGDLILVELLTITQWVKVRGDVCWYWWNCWPSLNELWWEVIVVDIGGIVDNHSMSYLKRWFLLIFVILLTITQWVKVRGDFCWYWWWNCWPSLNELWWEVIVVDISGIVDNHWMWLGERWFLLILVELLTITQWVNVRGDFCWYWWNCWPSLDELKWEVIFVDIGGIVDHHSMSWGERSLLLILVELLTITQWVEVRWDLWWYWWNCWLSLNELKWEVICGYIGGIVDHHSMSWSERWFLLILGELLTITQWVEVRGDFCWYWWNCWLSLNELKWEVICGDIGGIVDHHSMSWGERWFLLILVELLTITQWV